MNIRQLNPIKKIKVLGYPFAGGQPKGGVELTPKWLQDQLWFSRLVGSSSSKLHVEYEEIKVSNGLSNHFTSEGKSQQTNTDYPLPKNYQNVMRSSDQLSMQTQRALRDGYFPIVLGGDHSQAIGSISGMKKCFPDAKLLWVDAHIDANTPESSPSLNAHGMPLSYLSGQIPSTELDHLNCVDLSKDLCYFGIRSYEDEELQLVRDNDVLIFESEHCQVQNMDKIHYTMNKYFKSQNSSPSKYWISFDIDSMDCEEFRSTGTAEGNGLSLPFTLGFFQKFIPFSVGLDLTEVNFELTEGLTRQMDEQTFREIFEVICHSVNQPTYQSDELESYYDNVESISMDLHKTYQI